MPLNNSNASLQEIIDRLEKLELIEHKNILSLNEIPSLSMNDTIMLVTDAHETGKTSLESLMQYLNENLKNFICWKPSVKDNVLSWERSSNDQSPSPINFTDIIFPMASETTNGMMTSKDYSKLLSIDENNIVYNDKLVEELEKKAPLTHYHEQYQLKSDMPTMLSQFENDTKYITFDDVPKTISSFENDVNYITAESAPSVTSENRGFMTPDQLSMLTEIYGDYIDSSELDATKGEILASFPTNISSFINDSGYIKKSNLLSSFGELGAVNLLFDSQFNYIDYGSWTYENCNIQREYGDDYGWLGVITFTGSTSKLISTIKPVLGSNYVISFIARASRNVTLTVNFGGVSKTVNVTESFKAFEIKITRDMTNYSHDISFFPDESETEEFVLYLTHVKVERGSIKSDFSYSYQEIDMIRNPATNTTFGLVRPDGTTIVVDENTLNLKVNMSSIVGPMFNDNEPSDQTTYTSLHLEEIFKNKADLVDGKIPTEQLPSYVDDVVEGTMSTDGTVFTIAPDQNSSGDPSKGKIYLDTNTNIAYRWSGSAYIYIGEKYAHPNTSGNKHIPAGGESGQILGWNSDGEAKWVTYIYASDPITLSVDGWDASTKTQTVNVEIDTSCKNVIDATPDSINEWMICSVLAIEEYSNRLVFKCESIPTSDLNFVVTSINLGLKDGEKASISGLTEIKGSITSSDTVVSGSVDDIS